MRKSILWAIAACMTLTVACYDDSELQTRVDDLNTTVTKLESRVKDLESKVTGIQTTISLVADGWLVKDWQAVSDGSGYTLTLMKGNETKVITIKDGETPSVTVELKDGVYYWVINGTATEYPVTSDPSFKIAEGLWYVSFDGGKNWKPVPVEGTVPAAVTLTDNNDGTVTLTVDGKSIVLPKAVTFNISIDAAATIAAGQTITPAYKVAGATASDDVTVEAVADGGYTAEVVAADKLSGKISITAPAVLTNGKVIVFAADGKGHADMKVIKLSASSASVKDLDGVSIESGIDVPIEGNEALKVNVVSNIDYKVLVDQDWVTFEIAPKTKASHDDIVTFKVAKNEGDKRTASVKIVDAADESVVLQSFSIVQESALKTLVIKNEWVYFSTEGTAWNTALYGGAAGTDRNIAMDDDYVYIAESAATPKLWAIDRKDPKNVKAVNITGVAGGGAHPLTCPRVIKNTDSAINGGKDVLVCMSLTRGGVEPILYYWLEGIDKAPFAQTLVTSATGAWYGDTFTVYGTLQDGILLLDKTGGDNANGIVTFNLNGTVGAKNYLLKRLKFNDAFGSHNGVCAYYPFPGNVNAGIYSPGRGFESRGRNAVVTGDFKSEGNAAYGVALELLDFAEGRNGYVLAYNFVEWNGKRYVIYGKQDSSTTGKVYILEGEADTDWLAIANTAAVKFRRDLDRQTGCTLTSGNSGMDVTARIIDGDLYIAAQKQNIACGLYKMCLE